MSLSGVQNQAVATIDITDFIEEMKTQESMRVLVLPNVQPSATSTEFMALDGNTYSVDTGILHQSYEPMVVNSKMALYFNRDLDEAEMKAALPRIVATLLDSNSTRQMAVANRIQEVMSEDKVAAVQAHRAPPEQRDGCHHNGTGFGHLRVAA
ncbi:MAG: hypothetical protein AAF549_03165 [Pseudomonadota bacterium]